MTRTTQQQAIAFCESVRPEMVKRYCINTEGWNVWMLVQTGPGRALYHATKTKKPKDSRRSWEKIGALEGWNVWRSITTTGANL